MRSYSLAFSAVLAARVLAGEDIRDYAVGAAYPLTLTALAGTELRVMRLFAPDIGWLVSAITVTATLLACAAIAWAFASLQPPGRGRMLA